MRIGGARAGLAVAALGLVAGVGLPAHAAGGGLDITATVDGHSLQAAGSNSPIVLKPS
ncbi:MAG: hypothetical protein JWO12_156, partial [Frankiales bacterium]|nr:hypothetical protein [Frankiales bacterium]